MAAQTEPENTLNASTVPASTVTWPHGGASPSLGLGTCRYGEPGANVAAEVVALRLAFDIGYRVIDTAEMYASGGAETVLGQAVEEATRAGLARESLFIVSKVLPENAHTAGVVAACERSLRRLRLDCIDLYLLHWRRGVPLQETVRGFEALQQRGLIRHWGVSNFDVADLRELFACAGGAACSANQVWYSLSERGVEYELLPWQRAHHMPLMAYCPIDQGALVKHPGLHAVAQRCNASPAQVALAWVLAQPGVMAIPKAVQAEHLHQNWQAAALRLAPGDRAELDRIFLAPAKKKPLAMR